MCIAWPMWIHLINSFKWKKQIKEIRNCKRFLSRSRSATFYSFHFESIPLQRSHQQIQNRAHCVHSNGFIERKSNHSLLLLCEIPEFTTKWREEREGKWAQVQKNTYTFILRDFHCELILTLEKKRKKFWIICTNLRCIIKDAILAEKNVYKMAKKHP